MALTNYMSTEARGTGVLEMRPPDAVGDLLAANIRLRAENARLRADVQLLQELVVSVLTSYQRASDGEPLPE